MSDLTSISFARPMLLLLLALPVLLAAWELTRRGVRVALPFDHRPAAELRPTRRRLLGGLVTLANVLPPVLLAAAILLLAGPRRQVDGPRDRKLTNIQFCLDISGSMAAGFGDATRYDAAMAAVGAFTTHRSGDAFGLTVFGNDVLHWVPLTRDADAVRRAPPFVRPETMPRQFNGTSIGYALGQCGRLLSRGEEGDRLIILITDGLSADILGSKADEVAQELRADDVRVYPIHVGEGGPPAPLYTIAAVTGGEVFAAGDPAALDAVFAQIDRMQSAKLNPPGKAYDDHFGPIAWLALAVAGLHGLCLIGLRFTPW